jgi:hypothetical protein
MKFGQLRNRKSITSTPLRFILPDESDPSEESFGSFDISPGTKSVFEIEATPRDIKRIKSANLTRDAFFDSPDLDAFPSCFTPGVLKEAKVGSFG